jgi:hypothetical protein
VNSSEIGVSQALPAKYKTVVQWKVARNGEKIKAPRAGSNALDFYSQSIHSSEGFPGLAKQP